MLSQQERAEIYRLLEEGFSVFQIARTTRRSLMTIYRLRKTTNQTKARQSQPTYKKLSSPAQKYLTSRFRKGATNASKLYRELTQQHYSISYGTINRYIRELKTKIFQHRSNIPSTRFETEPGEQAQVDWGSFGKIEVNGRVERLFCFVYVLGYSRAMYIEFTVKQNLQILENCHINAFEQLGIPKKVVYDNMKTVVLRREKQKEGKPKLHYHPAFSDFAEHYGFLIEVCPPHWPRAKGKVEAGVKYIRNDFMQGMKFGKDFSSLDELNEKARRWLDTVANVRVHGTTGERPIDRLRQERKFLRFPHNLPRYQVYSVIERNSTKDSKIYYKSNLYSVPCQYARRKLFVKENSTNGTEILEIYFEDKLIATHRLSHELHKSIVNPAHLQIKPKKGLDKGSFQNKHSLFSGENKASAKTEVEFEDSSRPLSYYKRAMPDDNE